MTPRGLAVGLVAAVVLAATVPARLVAWACTSGEEEVGSDERICESIGEFGTWGWWAAVLWPAAVFAGAQVVPVLRRHPTRVAVSIAVLAAAFWIAVASISVDVG